MGVKAQQWHQITKTEEQQGQHPDNKHLHAVGLTFARVRAICVVNVFYLCVLEWSGVEWMYVVCRGIMWIAIMWDLVYWNYVE